MGVPCNLYLAFRVEQIRFRWCTYGFRCLRNLEQLEYTNITINKHKIIYYVRKWVKLFLWMINFHWNLEFYLVTFRMIFKELTISIK